MQIKRTDQKEIRIEFRATGKWLDTIDRWRSRQSPIPSRSEAIRNLTEKSIQRG